MDDADDEGRSRRDSGPPTKRSPSSQMKCPVFDYHDDDLFCTCVCHRQPMISHLKPCCRTCESCGKRIVILYPPLEGEEG